LERLHPSGDDIVKVRALMFKFASLLISVNTCRYGADINCQTNGKYTPLHRCAFYNHPRLASLLTLAGADQLVTDENGMTAYEVAAQKGNEQVSQLLKPIFSNDGTNISGIMYATNNPKHPNFRPDARQAFFDLFALNNEISEE
jgi:ankyrin repeat protein